MGEDNSAPVGSMNNYAHMDNNDLLDQIQAGPYLGQSCDFRLLTKPGVKLPMVRDGLFKASSP